MTPYTVDTGERTRIYYVAALASAALMAAIGHLKQYPLVAAGAPSAFVIFGLLLGVYEKWGWKLATKMGASDIPNLNGEWEGLIRKNTGEEVAATLRITQTWLRIAVSLETPNTTSEPTVAALFISNKNLIVLKMIYDLKPRHLAQESAAQVRGEGVNEIRIRSEQGVLHLEGWYFSSNFRGGQLQFERKITPAVTE